MEEGKPPDTPPGEGAPPPRPIRVQLSRAKGWRMPPNTVKVDRTTTWGNRYRVGGIVWRTKGFGKVKDAAEAVDLFRRQVAPLLMDIARLRGKNLACWCRLCPEHAMGKPFGEQCPACEPCHSDPLGELANRPLQSATLERKP